MCGRGYPYVYEHEIFCMHIYTHTHIYMVIVYSAAKFVSLFPAKLSLPLLYTKTITFLQTRKVMWYVIRLIKMVMKRREHSTLQGKEAEFCGRVYTVSNAGACMYVCIVCVRVYMYVRRYVYTCVCMRVRIYASWSYTLEPNSTCVSCQVEGSSSDYHNIHVKREILGLAWARSRILRQSSIYTTCTHMYVSMSFSAMLWVLWTFKLIWWSQTLRNCKRKW